MSERTQSLVNTPLLVVAITFPVLATLAVGLRFYARKIKSQALKSDDWTIVLTLLTCWVISINTFVAAGIAGVNTTSMNPLAAARLFLRTIWIEGIFLCLALAAVKIAILLFYRRIFVTRTFKWCVDIMVFVLIGWGISGIIAQILAGDPISSVWNPLDVKFRYNYWNYTLVVGGMSIGFDVIVLCFPFPVIRTLQMPTRRKITVLGIFWLGAFCCIAAAIRFHALYESIQKEKVVSATNYDEISTALIWQHIEPGCSIIAACLPTYGNLFTSKLSFFSSFRSLFSLRSRSGSRNKEIGGGIHGSETLILDGSNKSNNSGKAWQILDKNVENNSVEITAKHNSLGGEGDQDLESGIEMRNPMKIDVIREFGSESRVM